MKVLVTGGAGYIGSNLIAELSKNSSLEIISLDCYYTGKISNHINSENVEYIKGYTWQIQDLFENEKFDIIFHFGEYSRIVYSFEDIEFVHKSLQIGTYHVIEFAAKSKSKLIYSASSSKFGNHGKDENLSPYAFFKAKNVELIKNYKSWFGLNFEIVYFFNVYGKNHISKGKYATVVAIFENQYLRKEPLTIVEPGNQSRDFTHIDDIIDGLKLIYKQNRNHEWHLRSGKNVTISELAGFFQKEVKFIPERPGERFTSEYFVSDTNELIDFNPKHSIREYVENFKKVNNERR